MKSVFESRDVVRLVGMPPVYLNKFVERGLYGIRASVQAGVGRGRRRLFASGDVTGIALAWWLFQAGLRAEVIRRVLRDLYGKPEAKKASERLISETGDVIVIVRDLRRPRSEGKQPPIQFVGLAVEADIPKLLAKSPFASVHVLPFLRLMNDLRARIQLFEG